VRLPALAARPGLSRSAPRPGRDLSTSSTRSPGPARPSRASWQGSWRRRPVVTPPRARGRP